jgi:hypothetical protein
MNAHVRDVLRDSGAEAGRKARADAGLHQHVEDPQVVQRMAELLVKVGGRVTPPARNLGPPRQAEGAGIQRTAIPLELTSPVDDLTAAPLPLRRALSYGQQQRPRKFA